MAQQVNPPRGMRDFLPAQKARREDALTIVRSTYRRHGFAEIETPVVEETARLHSGLGGENEKLGFAVLKRGLSNDDFRAVAEGGDELALSDLGLRYDLTVPLARFYASHRAQLPTPFRAFQAAPVWRAERPQKGRYRQFHQCDIDIIGDSTVLAETELILATVDVLERLDLQGASIRVNDRRILTGLLDHFGFAPEEHDPVLITLDKLDRIGADGVIAELEQRLATPSAVSLVRDWLHRPVTLEHLPFGEAAIRKRLPDGFESVAVEDLVDIGRAVRNAADSELELAFDPLLVRGMSYYTGTIFEISHSSVPYSLGGGGRYDRMIGRFLGESIPAVGFSLGFERILDLLADAAAEPERDGIALLHDAGIEASAIAGLKLSLVRRGERVVLEPRARNTKRQLDDLAARGLGWFAFVDGDTSAGALDRRPLG